MTPKSNDGVVPPEQPANEPKTKPKVKGKAEGPLVHALGLTKAKGGWSVVMLVADGDIVRSMELVEGPESLALAWERFILTAVGRLYRDALHDQLK